MSKEDFIDETHQQHTDVSTVESQRNDLTAEEFPDGPYGSPSDAKLGKSTPWRIDQRPPHPFGYENLELHAGIERDYPGDQGKGQPASPN